MDYINISHLFPPNIQSICTVYKEFYQFIYFISGFYVHSYSDVKYFKIYYLYLVFGSSSYWFRVYPPLLVCCLYFSLASHTHRVVLYKPCWLLPLFEKIKTFPLHFLKELFSSVNCFCFLFMFYLEAFCKYLM